MARYALQGSAVAVADPLPTVKSWAKIASYIEILPNGGWKLTDSGRESMRAFEGDLFSDEAAVDKHRHSCGTGL